MKLLPFDLFRYSLFRTCIRFKEMSIADIRKYTKERINYVEFINEPGAG